MHACGALTAAHVRRRSGVRRVASPLGERQVRGARFRAGSGLKIRCPDTARGHYEPSNADWPGFTGQTVVQEAPTTAFTHAGCNPLSDPAPSSPRSPCRASGHPSSHCLRFIHPSRTCALRLRSSSNKRLPEYVWMMWWDATRMKSPLLGMWWILPASTPDGTG